MQGELRIANNNTFGQLCNSNEEKVENEDKDKEKESENDDASKPSSDEDILSPNSDENESKGTTSNETAVNSTKALDSVEEPIDIDNPDETKTKLNNTMEGVKESENKTDSVDQQWRSTISAEPLDSHAYEESKGRLFLHLALDPSFDNFMRRSRHSRGPSGIF